MMTIIDTKIEMMMMTTERM